MSTFMVAFKFIIEIGTINKIWYDVSIIIIRVDLECRALLITASSTNSFYTFHPQNISKATHNLQPGKGQRAWASLDWAYHSCLWYLCYHFGRSLQTSIGLLFGLVVQHSHKEGDQREPNNYSTIMIVISWLWICARAEVSRFAKSYDFRDLGQVGFR